ncbi:hypothetical protein MGSAQ_002976 [marine sediment metagenome]|uniref:Uncharacterized protein n=1 Tax=marine sediment metagenome TaxID=412755 RepID=A0A1B6NS27_9ZZZZ
MTKSLPKSTKLSWKSDVSVLMTIPLPKLTNPFAC